MSHPRRSTTKPKQHWGRVMALAGVALYLFGAVLLSMNGCETPEKRYKVLSFFFDGVPDPNAPTLSPGSEEGIEVQSGNQGRVTRVYTHKPYQEGQCDACHGQATEFSDFTKVGSDVCLKCHQKELNKFPIMHGPVSAGECLLCHTPHESRFAKLLKMPSPDVCVQCHLTELLPLKPDEHQTLAVSCLDCHFGHGGPKHGLLRKVASTAPTSQPSTRPTSQPTTLPDSDVAELTATPKSEAGQ